MDKETHKWRREGRGPDRVAVRGFGYQPKAVLAQEVERLAGNHKVAGSIPGSS